MTMENPYAPPASQLDAASTLPPALPQMEADHYRDGKFLIVKNGAVLPSSCLITNQPVTEGGRRKQMPIAWTPPWVYAIFVLGVLFAVIAILVFQKKGKITYSLSEQAWSRIVKRRTIGFILLVGGIVLIVAGVQTSSGSGYAAPAVIGGIIAIIGSLITLALASPIRATKFKNDWFRIKGCSPEFLQNLPEIGHSPFA